MVQQKVLYRKGVDNIYMRCVTKEGLRLITEIHEGSCSMHLASQTLAGKIKNQGYYWPTMYKDCKENVRGAPSAGIGVQELKCQHII